MQDRIGGFLGELTEELGWTPELEHARVKPATTETTMQRPRVLTPDDDSPELWATPVERLQAEVSQLRSTVKPLGSEVINLRAQMAKLRSVPVPPAAEDVEAAEITRARPRSGQDESTPTQSTWYDFYRPTQEDESHTISTSHCRQVPESSRENARGRQDLFRYHPAQTRPYLNRRRCLNIARTPQSGRRNPGNLAKEWR